MPSEPVALVVVAELREEADEARGLASMFDDIETVSDLLGYAATLEADADRCEEAASHPEDALMADKWVASMWPNVFFAGGSR